MNWNNEKDLIMSLLALQANRIDTLPEWAKAEKMYNCDLFGTTCETCKKNKVSDHKARKVVAGVLRKMADKLYPQTSEKKAFI